MTSFIKNFLKNVGLVYVPQFFLVFLCIFLGRKTTKNIREKKWQLIFFSISKQNPRHFSLKKIKKIKRGFKSSTKSSSVIIIQPKGE